MNAGLSTVTYIFQRKTQFTALIEYFQLMSYEKYKKVSINVLFRNIHYTLFILKMH